MGRVVRLTDVRPAFVFLAILLLAGCSLLSRGLPVDNGKGAGAGDGNDGGVTKSEPLDPPIEPPGDGSRRETPDPTVVDAHPAGLDHVVIGPDGRTVVVYWWGGTPSCFGLREVQVERDSARLTLTVLEGTLPEAVGKACTAEALLKSALVTLERPLLLDAVGEEPAAGEPQLVPDPLMVTVTPGVLASIPMSIAGYSTAPGKASLTAYFYGGVEDCYALAVAGAQRDGDHLVVTVREGRVSDVDVACDDIALAKAVEIRLADPLIVDGSAS
jgi:hypothetical protein